MAARATFQGGKRARDLHELGLSCNAMAKELGVSAATISRWAKREGLSFGREKTALAVRARMIDIADSRTLLAKKMLTVAHETLDKLDGTYLVYSFGGKDNTYEEHLLAAPPIEAVRTAQTIAKDAHVIATKTLEATPETLAAAESVLDRLEAQLDAEFAGDESDDSE